MSNYLYSSNAVDSLIDYINDVKPYHSKLSEIVEEYQFYESMNVTIDDGKKFMRSKIAGIWDAETYSNGLYVPFMNLPFIKQAKLSKYWNNNLVINPDNPDPQIAGLTTAYYLRHNIGLRAVTRNGLIQNEGIDFHVSHGAYSIDVDGENQKYVETILKDVTGDESTQWIKGLPIISEPSSVYYPDVESLNGKVIEIVPNLDDESYEEWELECIQASNASNGTKLSYEHVQSVPSEVWNIQHKLDSTDIFLQCYVIENGVLTPIFPGDVTFLDNNTINVKFSKARIGKVKLIRFIDSRSMYSASIVSPTDIWEINHNLNTTDLVYNVMVEINGVMEKINPKSIEFVDTNTVKVHFSTPKIGKISLGAINSYTSTVFVQDTPKDTWSFDNRLRTDSGVFLVYDADGNAIFPKEVTISNSLIFVKFSKPIAGKLLFAKLFTVGNENTIFSVKGSESGLIGYARVGLKFTSKNVSFIIKPKSENSVFNVGEKVSLIPDNRIITHKNYTEQEKWSFIKVNPIAYERPRFVKSGSPVIHNFVYKTTGIRPQVLTLTFDGEKFNVNSSLDGDIGIVNLGGMFNSSEYSFVVKTGTVSPQAGDYFLIEIFNEPPKVDGLDLTIGYDMTSYDDTEYDDRFISFDLTSLDLVIENPAVAQSYFELYYNGTEFEVTQFNNKISRNVISTFASIVPGVNYTCSEFSIKIPDNLSYVIGDTFLFDVNNPGPYFDEHDTYLISTKFGSIVLYPKSFIDSPGQEWEISIEEDLSVSVVGTVSGAKASGKITESYDNGLIHFTILPSDVPFAAGDRFFVKIKDEKPSYLVFGEKTGFTKPLTLGKWYWNGKIGIKIQKPYYHVHEYISVNENKQSRRIQTDTVKIDEDNSIDFIKPPRFDARSDVYEFTPLATRYNGNQLISVNSALKGIQRGALLNSRYIDDMRPEQSRFVGFDHHDGVIDVQINASNDLQHAIKFEVISDDPKLFHANDLIIFEKPFASTDKIIAERETVDKIYFKSNTNTAELGQEQNALEDQWFATYTAPVKPFSDENEQVDVYASLINKKIGTIKNYGIGGEQYRFEVDSDFFNEFLPFNSRLSAKVVQNEQENAIVKARITEKMRVFDYYRMYDNIDVTISETNIIKINTDSPIFRDVIRVTIDDTTFSGFFSGYDTSPFDIELNGYDDSESTQTEFFSASAGGIGYLVQNSPSSSKSVSKISETMTIYSRLSADALGFAEAYAETGLPSVDSFGWTNAEVIDGAPPVDAEGWQAAEFNIPYGVQTENTAAVLYDMTAYVSKLNIPAPGSLLYGTPYTNVPSALIDVNRKIAKATIMKRGLNATSVVMFSDQTLQTQIPLQIVENTPDYITISLTTPSIGKIIIF